MHLDSAAAAHPREDRLLSDLGRSGLPLDRAAAEFLTERLRGLPGLTTPVVRPGIRHGYYVYTMRYDASQTGVPRNRVVAADCAFASMTYSPAGRNIRSAGKRG